jgi:hypothetical protein
MKKIITLLLITIFISANLYVFADNDIQDFLPNNGDYIQFTANTNIPGMEIWVSNLAYVKEHTNNNDERYLIENSFSIYEKNGTTWSRIIPQKFNVNNFSQDRRQYYTQNFNIIPIMGAVTFSWNNTPIMFRSGKTYRLVFNDLGFKITYHQLNFLYNSYESVRSIFSAGDWVSNLGIYNSDLKMKDSLNEIEYDSELSKQHLIYLKGQLAYLISNSDTDKKQQENILKEINKISTITKNGNNYKTAELLTSHINNVDWNIQKIIYILLGEQIINGVKRPVDSLLGQLKIGLFEGSGLTVNTIFPQDYAMIFETIDNKLGLLIMVIIFGLISYVSYRLFMGFIWHNFKRLLQ